MEPFLLFDLKFDDTRNWYKLKNLNEQNNSIQSVNLKGAIAGITNVCERNLYFMVY